MTQHKKSDEDAKARRDDGPLMPFNEALKRVWSAPPTPKVKSKTPRIPR